MSKPCRLSRAMALSLSGDGMHPIRHSYTLEQVRPIARALDEAGVDAIEVSHGEFAGSNLYYEFGLHGDEA